jgi:hypothetical protein
MRFRNHHAGCCGFNPTRPDGSEWDHVLTLHDGSTVHADTAAEVLEEIIEAYTSFDERGRLAARTRLAEQLASASQEVRIRSAIAQGTLDPADSDHAGLMDVLRADKAQSMSLETEDAPGVPAAWVPETMLVLVATRYAPHTAYPRITGNVAYLDPSDDDALLASLARAQIFDYWCSGAAQRP